MNNACLRSYTDNHRDVVYMLPKVIYPDGKMQYLCKLLPTPFDLIGRRFLPKKFTKRWNDIYILKASGYDRVMNPPCLSGCFMFLQTYVLKRYDLMFDERFFMYCEDFDLMRRLHRIGKTIFYLEVQIVHLLTLPDSYNIGLIPEKQGRCVRCGMLCRCVWEWEKA